MKPCEEWMQEVALAERLYLAHCQEKNQPPIPFNELHQSSKNYWVNESRKAPTQKSPAK